MKCKSNQVVYKDFIQTKLLLDNKYKSFASRKHISFLEEIKLIKKNKVKMRCRHWLKYAAVLLCVVWLFFFMNQNRGLPVVGNDLIITKDAITLELANGDLKVIPMEKKGLLVKQVKDSGAKWSDIEL
jgi:hypothetical protein